MKAIGFLAVLCAAAVTAHAEVEALYWQVTPESNPNGVQFQSAALHYDDGAGNSGYLPNGSSSGSEWAKASSGGTSTELQAAILGEVGPDRSGWSFYIELQNYDADTGNWYTAGSSSTFTYAQAASALRTSSSLDVGAPTAMVPTVSIPEPTSGMLVLVGGVLLAWRRRRV